MRTKTTRHNPEKIKSAISLLDAGTPLTEVAKQMGVAKSLVKYWKDRAVSTSQPQTLPAVSLKVGQRSRKFIERCWSSMSLAFAQLNRELKKENSRGIKDLALTISILWDKMAQANQSLQAHSPGVAQDWNASEDTLLILRRHREGAAAPKDVTPVESGLGGRDVEQEKKTPDGGVGPEGEPHA